MPPTAKPRCISPTAFAAWPTTSPSMPRVVCWWRQRSPWPTAAALAWPACWRMGRQISHSAGKAASSGNSNRDSRPWAPRFWSCPTAISCWPACNTKTPTARSRPWHCSITRVAGFKALVTMATVSCDCQAVCPWACAMSGCPPEYRARKPAMWTYSQTAGSLFWPTITSNWPTTWAC
ncbi:hypothetical protein D3C84_891280 [compost metagenome]